MNYTKNYHLPQWAETDRIQMEDFNEAMADIDEAMGTYYGMENLPWEMGSANISEGAKDTVIHTFGFTPSVVLAWASSYYMGATDGSTTISLRGSASNSGLFDLRLSGAQLKLTYFYNGPPKVYFLALR